MTSFKIITLSVIILFSTAISAAAGERYYGYGHHYDKPHYHSYKHRNYYSGSSEYFWAFLGAAVLTGILFNSLTSRPPAQKRVLYQTPVYSTLPQTPAQRIFVSSQPLPDVELILRRVETTPHILNMRSTPDTNSEIAGQVLQGTVLGVIGAAPEWLYIKTDSGRYGWIREQYTRPVGSPVG
ncbi:MAG: SH3 domain-containing protein [Desulfopila sp.]|nr:SH3 domain-containing protein [Desulfopila sp.]